MNETPSKQLSETLAETAQSRRAAKRKPIASVRVSPGSYLALAALLTFISLVLLRTNKDFAALVLVVTTWVVVPALVMTDRLYFDGKVLFRSGLTALISRLVLGRRPQLTVAEVERVEVATLRTLRRGGTVRYRYRVEISGKTDSFVFASGGKRFRQLIQALLPRIVEPKLDARACELRDYLRDPRELDVEVDQLGIATASLLEETDERARNRIESRTAPGQMGLPLDDPERAQLLRRVANDLRIAGRLRESAEAFRRALHLSSHDPWLLYDFARMLRSQAAAFGDASLLSRACAALKLAQQRNSQDARLMERIGESFFEFGQPTRAAKVLRRAIDVDDNSYRAHVGMAEVSLSSGKLAHVIHHFRDASRVAPDQATARMARSEADYYSRLNDDDDYLSSELRRMNWLEGAGRIQRLTARVSFTALLVALVGSFVDQVVTGVGWAVASSSIIGWSGALLIRKFLSRRRRIDFSL